MYKRQVSVRISFKIYDCAFHKHANSVSHSFKSLFFNFVFGGARVTNLVVFFLCYRSSNSLRLLDVQTCSKFGRKQTHLFRPTISTSTVCLVVSSAVSILCFSESLHLKPSKHTVYNIKTWLLTGAVLVLVERVFKSSPS